MVDTVVVRRGSVFFHGGCMEGKERIFESAAQRLILFHDAISSRFGAGE